MSMRITGCFNPLDNLKAEEVGASGYVMMMMMDCGKIAFQP